MKTLYRIFVKRPPEEVKRDTTGVQQDIAHSVDVEASEVYSTMRDLEKKFPGHRISSKQLNPLGL